MSAIYGVLPRPPTRQITNDSTSETLILGYRPDGANLRSATVLSHRQSDRDLVCRVQRNKYLTAVAALS
jgi:hypothetical protein